VWGVLNADSSMYLHIIASPSCHFKKLDKIEIKKIFLKKRQYIKGEFIIVLDNPQKKIYKKFVYSYLHKTIREIKAYWMRMLFTGKKIPPATLSVAKLKAYNDNICYITYINKGIIFENWHELKIMR